jgi:uncharacterized protein (DUF58 family)
MFNIFSRRQKESAAPLFDEKFLRRLERLNFRTAPQLRGNMLGEQRSRKLRPALDFSDHRPYTPGDDLRHIDWNIYAHHEELFVKLGESSQSINVHILVDASRSMAWEPNISSLSESSSGDLDAMGRQRSKWNVARRLAGALAYLALSGGERLTITTYTDTLGQSFGPAQGKQRTIPALNFLSSLQSAPPTQNGDQQVGLAESLTRYARGHSEGGMFILISDLMETVSSSADSDDVESGAQALAEGLRHLTLPRWQVMVMHLLSKQEVKPTFEGDFEFEDIETTENLPFYIDQATLSQYRLRVKRWCAALESACARQGTVYSRILSEWPLEQKVIPFLRQRGVIR